MNLELAVGKLWKTTIGPNKGFLQNLQIHFTQIGHTGDAQKKNLPNLALLFLTACPNPKPNQMGPAPVASPCNIPILRPVLSFPTPFLFQSQPPPPSPPHPAIVERDGCSIFQRYEPWRPPPGPVQFLTNSSFEFYLSRNQESATLF